MLPKKTYFNWSTGKDSALALYYLLQYKGIEVSHLITSVNQNFDRVSMHGLRRSLMEKQISEIGIPFSTIELPEEPDMKIYENRMIDAITKLTDKGYSHAAFGDIFLEDLKEYRINQLKKVNIEALFPLWKRNTTELIHEFLELGFKAITVSTNANLLPKEFIGREIDKEFIKDLPKNVDPCGENGEFHTFCFDGPIFKKPIDFEIGDVISKSYKNPGNVKSNMEFWYCDLI